ncbi:MAG TPA: tetratricopeptide repeat protein [Blastocatellia bacterium]|nr:tetratricopeptide repeat protein [Blastocatellia bacterium]
MPFDFDTPKTFFEKTTKAIDWIVEEIVRQKNWRSLLALLDVILFIAFNPFQWPFPNLLSLSPQLEKSSWYAPVFWSLIGVIFVIAVIVAARAKRKPAERPDLKQGAIKGLLPFGYEDAEVFSHLQRDQNLKECLQAIGDEQWRLGVLSGESGAGKTSFLQAGLWPEMERRKFRCVYVKFSDLDPFESVKRACLKHLSFADGATDAANFPGLLRAAAEQDRTPIALLFDQFEQFFVHRKRKKDREPFVQALAQWFAEMQSLPIKILICVRGDFLDRLNELQKAMRYSLSPTQSFRLERFEPDQATEVLCFLAEKDGLEYDRKFVSEMTRQELADTEDGLISPVDIQVLARMIERQTIASVLMSIANSYAELGAKEKSSALLSDAIKTAERNSDDSIKADILRGTVSFIAMLEDREKASQSLSDAIKAAERISKGEHKANALIGIAESYAEIGNRERASALLSDAIKAAEEVSDDDSKAYALTAIAKSYAKLGDKERAIALLLNATKTAEQISNEFSKASSLSQIVEFYAKLAESSNDPALHDVTFRLIEGVRDDDSKYQALDAILSSKFATADVGRLRSLTSHYGVGGPGKARALARVLMACSHPELIGK